VYCTTLTRAAQLRGEYEAQQPRLSDGYDVIDAGLPAFAGCLEGGENIRGKADGNEINGTRPKRKSPEALIIEGLPDYIGIVRIGVWLCVNPITACKP